MTVNEETQIFLEDVEGDSEAGLRGLPIKAEDGAPEDAKYLFHLDELTIKHTDGSGKSRAGIPWIAGRAVVDEPEEWEGSGTRFMLFPPVHPGVDASASDLRKYDNAQKRFRGDLDKLLGDEGVVGMPTNLEDFMSTLAEMLEGVPFVGQMKMSQARNGFESRPELGAISAADTWGEEG